VIGFIAEPTIAAAIEPLVARVVGEDRASGTSVVIGLVIATVATMVVGELVPKSIAIARPRATAYALASPMVVITSVLGPVIRVLNGAANWSVRRFGIEPQEELTSVRSLEELELLIRASGEEGTLDAEALNLLTRSIRFGEKDAASALVPRRSVQSIGVDDVVSTLADRAVATGHSRFPVVGVDLDDVRGVVHVKDVYRVPYEERAARPVESLMAPAFVVPETRDLADLLVDLRRAGSHLAVVVDEHGGTAGIITLEDILEEIVGEIDDEHDRPTPVLTRVQRPGEWLLDGTLHPDEVFDACGFAIPAGDYETLAGFVLWRLGHIPEAGERFDHDGWSVEVVELDGHRVATVRLRRSAPRPRPEARP
jgi:CBS domain containing-hemolysin-like protein